MKIPSVLRGNPQSDVRKTSRVGIHMTIAYVFALTIIASLSFGAHLVLNSVIKDQASTAHVINVAATERMLSQRVAMAAMDYMHGNAPEAQARLKAAITAMRGGHEYLVTGGRNTNDPFILTDGVRNIYFGSTYDFDSHTRLYMAQADLVASERNEQAFAYVKAESDVNMIRLADKVTQILETEAGNRTNYLRTTQHGVLIVLLLTLAAEACFVFRPMANKILRLTRNLYDMAIKDSVTGILTKRAFHDYAVKTLATCLRAKIPCALLLIDIDAFAAFNKQHGHRAGDKALRRIGAILTSQLRTGDILARYDSNMFIVMLPATDLPGTTIVAERLREVMALQNEFGQNLTISAGISYARPMIDRRNPDTLDALIMRARESLQWAKEDGGNIVMISTNPQPAPVVSTAI